MSLRPERLQTRLCKRSRAGAAPGAEHAHRDARNTDLKPLAGSPQLNSLRSAGSGAPAETRGEFGGACARHGVCLRAPRVAVCRSLSVRACGIRRPKRGRVCRGGTRPLLLWNIGVVGQRRVPAADAHEALNQKTCRVLYWVLLGTHCSAARFCCRNPAF